MTRPFFQYGARQIYEIGHLAYQRGDLPVLFGAIEELEYRSTALAERCYDELVALANELADQQPPTQPKHLVPPTTAPRCIRPATPTPPRNWNEFVNLHLARRR